MSNTINKTVASQLKKIRAEKAWSLEKTSQACGVSKAMLGQIERGESSPTVAKLWKIATGFSLPLSYFLQQESLVPVNHDIDVQISDAQNNGEYIGDAKQLNKPINTLVENFTQDKNLSIDTVFTYDNDTGIEVFELTFAVGHQQQSTPHQLGVIEHIIVTTGTMQYFVDQKWTTLKVGDKAKFYADKAHIYRNIGDIPLRFLNIIHYPK